MDFNYLPNPTHTDDEEEEDVVLGGMSGGIPAIDVDEEGEVQDSDVVMIDFRSSTQNVYGGDNGGDGSI